jgi:DNA-binding transcriptional LysR family regulator
MDWDKLRVFHAVAEAGSFTHAGEVLNLSQSAVSRQIGALEESLDVPLFHRHARGLILTEQGELLLRTVRDIFAKLAMTEGQLSESKDRPQGPLKVTTTVAFGSIWLVPRLKEFLELYPDIEMTAVLADTELDLSMREADVAIRMMPPRQPDLVQRHLFTMKYKIYAVPEYIKKRGMPKTAADLDDHQLIAYGEMARPPVGNANWLLEAGLTPGKKRDAVLKVNSVYGIFRAVQSGLGIGALPEYISRESTNLVELLPEIEGPEIEAFFVYPEELRHSQRIAVFRDFLIRKIGESGLASGAASARPLRESSRKTHAADA